MSLRAKDLSRFWLLNWLANANFWLNFNANSRLCVKFAFIRKPNAHANSRSRTNFALNFSVNSRKSVSFTPFGAQI